MTHFFSLTLSCSEAMMGKSTNAKLMFPFLSTYASVSVKHLRFGHFWRRNDVKSFGARFFVAILLFCQSRLLHSQHMAEDCVVLC